MHWRRMLERNNHWATSLRSNDPEFFNRIAGEHRPRAMFIGCSDARVPANMVTASALGELFVHRNIANQVLATDASLSAGLQFAIEVLGVEDVIVCGHEGCGGVRASLVSEPAPSLVDAWLAPLRLLARLHAHELEPLDPESRANRMVQLNVVEQVRSLARHPAIRGAWAAGRALRLHGWHYDLNDGLIRPAVRVDDATCLVTAEQEIASHFTES